MFLAGFSYADVWSIDVEAILIAVGAGGSFGVAGVARCCEDMAEQVQHIDDSIALDTTGALDIEVLASGDYARTYDLYGLRIDIT